MRILHISDLHFSNNTLDSFKQYYLTALLNDLKKWNEEKHIDIFCFTGDLVDKGGISFTSGTDYYQTINNEFIQKIANSIKLTNSEIFILPGNHDVNENMIDEFYESGLLNNLNSIEKINEFIEKKKNNFQGLERIQKYKELSRPKIALQ